MRKRGRNRVGNVGEKNGGEGCGTRSGAAPREERERVRGRGGKRARRRGKSETETE